MERSTVIAVDAVPTNAAAFLTLKSGVSGWCLWSFDACDVGASITVGACERCDWQVVAPGVAPIALLFTGQTLFVKSERLCGRTLLNNCPLWPGWVPLEHGDVVELGSARLEVSLKDASARPESARRISSGAAACPNEGSIFVANGATSQTSAQIERGHTDAKPMRVAPADWYARAHVENASYVPMPAQSARAKVSSGVRPAMARPPAREHVTPSIAASQKSSRPRHDVHVITAPQWGAQRAATGAWRPSYLEPASSFAQPAYAAAQPAYTAAYPAYAAESSSAFLAERSAKRLDMPAGRVVNAGSVLNERRVAADSPRPAMNRADVRALADGLAQEACAVPHNPLYRQTVKQWAPTAQPKQAQSKQAAAAKNRASFVPRAAAVAAKTSGSAYAALGVLTALAYVGWLVVLDYL